MADTTPELGTFHLGANIDTRPPEEAAQQDIKAVETIASATAVDWKEMAPTAVRVFGVQDQSGKSDCVAETRRKLKRILFNVNKGIDIDFSSVWFYGKRVNKGTEGMAAYDAIAIDHNKGMTLDALVPSDAVRTEAAANALVSDAYNDDVAKIFATADSDIVFNPGDLETIAGTVQKTRKGAMIWFFATVAEWSQLVPTIQIPGLALGDPRAIVVHSITAIEPALYLGKKGMWVDDSAHFGGLSRRFITEEFFRARNWFASYPMSFKFEVGTSTKPQHRFTKDLKFSATFFTDPDVVALQDILKYEGCMPVNVDSTGYFGALTLDGVKKLQVKHNIVPAAGYVGTLTCSYLNNTYGG